MPDGTRALPRFFDWLLRALPREFRAAHREEIAQLVASYASNGSELRRAWVWTRAGMDVVMVGLGLRVSRWWRTRREGRTMIDVVMQDTRFALRALWRRPGFTLVAVATLAIGIGANTAIFSVVDGVLLRPLPYANADRIGILWHEFGDGAQNLPAVHALDAWDYRDRSELLEDVVVASGREWTIGGTEAPELVDVGIVEPGFFEFFGAHPELGRAFTEEDGRPGAAAVVMLSHRLWARAYGADPSIVGRAVDVEGSLMQVVGVLPASFRLHLPAETFLLRDAELWTATRINPDRMPPRNYTGYTAFVRLREDVSFAQAQAELESMEATLKAEHPEHAASNLQARVVPLLEDVVKQAETTLLLLFGAVGFVLLIACANVANLVIVRGHGRSRELSLRAALGAGRGGLVRLTLVESGIIAAAGAALGVFLAQGLLSALRVLGPASVPRLESVTLDERVLAFVVLLALSSAVLFGFFPALRGASRDPADALQADGRSSATRGQRRFRDALVVAQVAGSLVLLVGTGLMVRGFAALASVDPGYDTGNVLSFRVSLPYTSFPDGEEREAIRATLFEQLGALPGVESVAAVNKLPLTGSGALQPYAYDEETASNWESVTADQRYITPGFMETLGARLVAGREFDAADAHAGNNIIVDDRLAARAFGDEDAVGQRLQVNPSSTPDSIRYAHIIGVVEHLRIHDLAEPHLTQIWYPMGGSQRFSVVLRTSVDPATLAAPASQIVARLAPGAPVEDMRTLGDLASTSLAPVRLSLALMTGFGAIALLLASVGLYGVLAYTVSRRTREIGVRMALGLSPHRVRGVVMLDGARLVVLAVVVGLVLAALLSDLTSGLVYGVDPLDPLTYLGTSLVLVTVAAAACWVPARRATRVDPATALRE